ncbi:MAG: glycosyltransferase family 4 protein [Segatella copri]|nr:glycosyltransferase family 4 protein [Segatella copri]
MNRMKILVIEGRRTIGGGQVITKDVCETLSTNHSVSVFLPGDNRTPISKFLSTYKQYYFDVREYKRGKKSILDYFGFIYNTYAVGRALFSVMRKEKFDLLYMQHLSMLPIVVAVNLLFHTKMIAHVHVVYTDKRARWLVNKMLRNKSIVKVIGVSNFCLSQFLGLDKNKCRIVFNPVVSLPPVQNPNSEVCNIAVVGDVCMSKGQHVLLKALAGKGRKYKVHIIGNIIDTQYKDYLDKQFPNVNHVYTGMIADVAGYMKDNSVVVVVVVSVVGFETFSLAMVEAWGMGIPTIATNDFGMKELVNKFLPKYSEKVLFPLGDSEALYQRLEELLSNKDLYDEFSKQAWDVVNTQLNYHNFSTRINQIIEEISYD